MQTKSANKKTTSGHPILMGRTTFDSIGRPLPKRQNIVLTRDPNWSHDGVEVIHDISQIKDLTLLHEMVYIIGGAQIYDLFLDQLDELIVVVRWSEVRRHHVGQEHAVCCNARAWPPAACGASATPNAVMPLT